MSTSQATANWTGSPTQGSGHMKLPDGHDVSFSHGSRFEGEAGGNPEQLIGAALAGCYSMALATALAKEGMEPERIETKAIVSLEREPGSFGISRIELHTLARVPDADPAKFQHVAMSAKESCPVAKALIGTSVTVEARLD